MNACLKKASLARQVLEEIQLCTTILCPSTKVCLKIVYMSEVSARCVLTAGVLHTACPCLHATRKFEQNPGVRPSLYRSMICAPCDEADGQNFTWNLRIEHGRLEIMVGRGFHDLELLQKS